MEMTEEAKEARRAYQREWRKRNPERVREYERRRWVNKAKEFAARKAELERGVENE